MRAIRQRMAWPMVLMTIGWSAHAADMVTLPAGTLRSAISAPKDQPVRIASFKLDRTPVTRAQFAAFLARHPEWRRDRVARLFADQSYLASWSSERSSIKDAGNQPVTQVSWFAASTYCRERGGRLPTWNEWEYAAAADETHRDARNNAVWRQRILDWYATPNSAVLKNVGSAAANVYGVHDLHGLIWEWVEDFNSIMMSSDNRAQGAVGAQQFCGSSAQSLEQKENYALMMRIAMLSSLEARYTTQNLGFRCAMDSETKQ